VSKITVTGGRFIKQEQWNAGKPSENWCLASINGERSQGSGGITPSPQKFEIVYVKSCNTVHFGPENGSHCVLKHFNNGNAAPRRYPSKLPPKRQRVSATENWGQG